MFTKVLEKVFKSKSARDFRRMQPLVGTINAHAESYRALSEAELQAKTTEFRDRLERGETLEDLLPEAFAVVKEACRRMVGRSWPVVGRETTWNMVPYDVQLVGGMALHEGRIAEMATGEGKTLVATMPVYLNALAGKGVHLVTVNDYLARRDGEWMGQVYKYLGLTVGIIQQGMMPVERQHAYACDITYGTNNEFGFDYLRDNMATRLEDRVHRDYKSDKPGKQFAYAIIDEVDSVLVDEARTPLIIAGPVPDANQNFDALKPGIEHLVRVQSRLVSEKLAAAEKFIDGGLDKLDGDSERDLGFMLLQVKRGSPKNKQFMKLLAREGSLQKLILHVEGDLMRDKMLHTADEDLYYAIDERGNVADLTERGRDELAQRIRLPLTLPDLALEVKAIEDKPGVDAQDRAAMLEKVYSDYASASDSLHDIGQLLKAYSLFEKDVEYVVQDGKVMIVDEFTGRLMPGRRFSDGLHQALEAKENVRVEQETQTMATVTLQNLFRMYEKLGGMTGTAETEAEELKKIYDLEVMVIPTHQPIRRIDYDDYVYKTRREKYNAVIEEIAHQHERGMPVLVGTVSVEASETLSRMLKRKGIAHEVLNARQHQREADIVALAGQKGAVTIATNMAGRGTDIKLGDGVIQCDRDADYSGARCPACPFGAGRAGAPATNFKPATGQLEEPCGLQIIGTERHESRRIDRQLRGRAGRQGDPGSSRFFLSLEDDLMRLFNSQKIAGIMDRLGVQDGEVITHSMVTRAIGRAQKRVEAHNFDIREHLLKYDDVMNKQREVIYANRLDALRGADLADEMRNMAQSFVSEQFNTHCEEAEWPQVAMDPLLVALQPVFLRPFHTEDLDQMSYEAARENIVNQALQALADRETALGSDLLRQLERWAYLRAIDDKWKDHLRELDHLRSSVGLRAYGQKDPLLEYKSEAFSMLGEMLKDIDKQTLWFVFHAQISVRPPEVERQRVEQLTAIHSAAQSAFGGGNPPVAPQAATGPARGAMPPLPQAGRAALPPSAATAARAMRPGAPAEPVRPTTVRNTLPKVGRNEQCPCGSGKKYKFCHGTGE